MSIGNHFVTHGVTGLSIRGEKIHKLFQHKLFVPRPEPPFWAPRKKLCASFPGEKNAKKGHEHRLSGGILGVENGAPKGPFSDTKSLVYWSFPALILSATPVGVQCMCTPTKHPEH